MLACLLQGCDMIHRAGNGRLANIQHTEGVEQDNIMAVDKGGQVRSFARGSGKARLWQAMAHGFISGEGPCGGCVRGVGVIGQARLRG